MTPDPKKFKKPEKKKDTGDLTTGGFEQARNRGYNQCWDEYEKFLPSKEEILNIMLNTWSIGAGQNKKERFKKIAKAIAKAWKE